MVLANVFAHHPTLRFHWFLFASFVRVSGPHFDHSVCVYWRVFLSHVNKHQCSPHSWRKRREKINRLSTNQHFLIWTYPDWMQHLIMIHHDVRSSQRSVESIDSLNILRLRKPSGTPICMENKYNSCLEATAQSSAHLLEYCFYSNMKPFFGVVLWIVERGYR